MKSGSPSPAPDDPTIQRRLLALSKAVGGLILGIDSSWPWASVCTASARSGQVVEHALDPSEKPSEALSRCIAQELETSAPPQQKLSAIVVAIGPGSFTGLRVGLATAKGLALGTNCSLFGISSLAVLAASCGSERVAIIQDARRGEFYTAIYDVDPDLQTRVLVADNVRSLEAFGPELTRHQPQRVIGDQASLAEPWVSSPWSCGPLQPRIARGILSAEQRIREGRADSRTGLSPAYFRVSAAESNLNKRDGA